MQVGWDASLKADAGGLHPPQDPSGGCPLRRLRPPAGEELRVRKGGADGGVGHGVALAARSRVRGGGACGTRDLRPTGGEPCGHAAPL